jgi:uncharacterized membrane protein
MNTQRAATRFLLFALIGLLMEVFFTAIADGVGGDIDLRGSTSPWMMIDYGILGIALLPLKAFLDKYGLPLPARAFVYMLGIFFVEYVSGLAFVAAGLHVWDYSHHPYNLHGQITLYYAPFWFGLGLVVEALHRRVDACAVMLLRGWTAEELMETPRP